MSKRTANFELRTDAGHVVGHCKEVKKYAADAWRPAAPTELAGARVHTLTIDKKIELQCSYATALAKVLNDPANKHLRAEFARQP